MKKESNLMKLTKEQKSKIDTLKKAAFKKMENELARP